MYRMKLKLTNLRNTLGLFCSRPVKNYLQIIGNRHRLEKVYISTSRITFRVDTECRLSRCTDNANDLTEYFPRVPSSPADLQHPPMYAGVIGSDALTKNVGSFEVSE